MTDSIPLSALQHYLFCPRQCALIYLEQQWEENQYTAEGRVLHERTDRPGTEKRKGVRTVTAMPLQSTALGIHGVADVVEFHKHGKTETPYPVEYKRGKPKAHHADEVQLCAQALCLEEMLNVAVDDGALFYGKTRRRTVVQIDTDLRQLTCKVITQTTALLASNTTPPPLENRTPCRLCSLEDVCQPDLIARHRSASHWFARQLES